MTYTPESDRNPVYNFFKQTAQKITITCTLFLKNDLFTHAASAAFAFLLSVFPIFLMLLIILTRLLNNSPEILQTITDAVPQLKQYIRPEFFSSSLLTIRKIGIFEVVTGFGILWAARKLFYSVQTGLTAIHRSQGKRTVLFQNIIPILCELIIVAVYAGCFVIISTTKTLLTVDLPWSFLTPFFIRISVITARLLPLFLLLVFCFVSYKTVPRIKIKTRHALFSASLCTLSFHIIKTIFFKVVNTQKYNLIYGLMSNLIMAMLMIYIFFQLFLFFAQHNFVQYYFDILLLSRVYLLPPETDTSLTANIFRLLYIHPNVLYRKYAVFYNPGDSIFESGSNADYVFYMYYGISEETGGKIGSKLRIRGEFFGETDHILHRKRMTSARSLSAAAILKIPADIFDRMLTADVRASLKTGDVLKEYIQSSENSGMDS